MSVADHVKIPTNDPRGGGWGSNGAQLIKESSPILRGGGSIDVGSKKGEGGGGGGKVDREGVRSGGRAKEGEGGV